MATSRPRRGRHSPARRPAAAVAALLALGLAGGLPLAGQAPATEPAPESPPAESPPAQSPAESSPSPSTPAQTAPAQSTPAQSTPAQSTPAQSTPSPSTPPPTTPAQPPAAGKKAGPVAFGKQAFGRGSDLPPAPATAGRTQFQLPFPKERGGGMATGTAGTIDYLRERSAVLSGGVDLRYRNLHLTAEQVEVDLAAKVVKATGDVVIDQGPQRVTGATATWDLDAQTGTLTEATAHLDPDIFFTGAEISKVSEDVFTLRDGIFTSCSEDEVPDWSFHVASGRIKEEGYAHLRGASMRVKKLPVLYTPRLLWPVKRERAAGLLVPQPGYSNRRGASLSMAYFQPLGRSYDTTLFTDLYSQGFLGLGNETRWAPSAGTEGGLKAYFFETPQAKRTAGEDQWRWKLALDTTTTDLPFGMRGILAYRDYSDFNYLQDVERNLDRNSTRSIYSRGSISGNWGAHSFNLLIDRRETLVRTDADGNPVTVTLSQLPTIDYSLRETRIGATPLYFKLAGSGAFLSQQRSAALDASYGRFDVFPTVRLPFTPAPWLDTSVSVGERYTWWGDSLCRPSLGPDDQGPEVCTGGQTFTNETLSRTYPLATLEVVGPSFSRVFNHGLGPYAKFKHVIQPRWDYTYQGDVDPKDIARTPQFDSTDPSQPSLSVGTFTLVNLVKAKRREKKPATAVAAGEAGAAQTTAAGGTAEAAAAPAGEGAAAATGETAAATAAAAPATPAGESATAQTAAATPAAEGAAAAVGEAGAAQTTAAGGTAEAMATPAGEGAAATPAAEGAAAGAVPEVPGGGGAAEEIVRLEIAQRYSFDSRRPLQTSGDRSLQEGPITALLQVSTGSPLLLRSSWAYNTLFNRVTSRSVSGNAKLPHGYSLGLSWFSSFKPDTGETLSDQIQVTAGLNLLPNRLRLDARVGYDIHNSETLQQGYMLNYVSQCFSIRLEVQEFTAGLRQDRNYRIALTLKNVGTFLDLAGRQSNAGDY
jgi:lipopolysaccharide assembly outer membrane protein LptD (OstA)